MIHPTAIIHSAARLAEGVSVGAYACIGAGVDIGSGCRIGAHAVLEGLLTLGVDNDIGPHAILGTAPQDRSYRGEPTQLHIGERNVIREFVTIHRASTKEQGVTRIGHDNLFMAYGHIGHDCQLGNHITMSNATQLAGHVTVHDHANISALCGVHQFVRIGAHIMLGGGSMVTMDIPPFTVASGNQLKLFGLNRRGLRRNRFEPATIHAIHQAYRLLFQSGLRLQQAVETIEARSDLDIEPIRYLLQFIRDSQRGIAR